MSRAGIETTHLAEVVAPRDLEASIASARGMFGALAGESISLEITTGHTGPRWYVRSTTDTGLERALAQLRAAYPQARAELIPPDRDDLDPVRVLGPEQAVVVGLRPSSGDILSLRSDWRNEPSPLVGVLARAAPREDERVVCRLTLGPAPAGAAGRLHRRAAPAGAPRREPAGDAGPSLIPLVGALTIAAAGLKGREWYLDGEWALLVAGGACVFVGLPLAGALAMRMLRSPEPLPPGVVEQKLGSPLVSASLEVHAIGWHDSGPERLRLLARETAAAYGAYDSAGGGLRPAAPRAPRRRPDRKLPLLLNTAELAGLWHLPDQAGAPAGIRRTTARRLPPAPGHAARGARVGASDADGSGAPVHLPAPLLHRNQLIVAKTRRGKSTLLRHLAARVMEGIDGGSDETALVVVDPHQDLAEAVLDAVPPELADRTTYLDFANLERPVGLNLLDVSLFPDRDRTTEHIVTMMNRLWPANWGPRMEGALRASLLALLDANRHYEREAQFTLLDVAPMLTDRELRERVLDQVQDPAVRAWWRDNYDRAGRVLQQQTANPVTSKIGRFTVTEASRLVFGQARSTFDPRGIVRDGGVLVVNTAVGALGEGAASLVGATLLNLLGLLIEEQVALPPERRRKVIGLIDESSTLGAVDYTRMLSELGKYGASFVLVTQSLAKLDAIDRNLAPTIFANSDGLTVFGVSAEDARRLTPGAGRRDRGPRPRLARRLHLLCALVGRPRPPACLLVPGRSAATDRPGPGPGDRGTLRRASRPPARAGGRGDHAGALGALAVTGSGPPGAEVPGGGGRGRAGECRRDERRRREVGERSGAARESEGREAAAPRQRSPRPPCAMTRRVSRGLWSGSHGSPSAASRSWPGCSAWTSTTPPAHPPACCAGVGRDRRGSLAGAGTAAARRPAGRGGAGPRSRLRRDLASLADAVPGPPARSLVAGGPP